MRCADCELAAVRLRELQEELDAWRAADFAAIETGAAAIRLVRWRNRLENLRPVVVKTLIMLADGGGRILSVERIARLGGRDVDDICSAENLARGSVCQGRAALRLLGLAAGLRTVRGVGYRMEPEIAQRLRTLMGDFDGIAS